VRAKSPSREVVGSSDRRVVESSMGGLGETVKGVVRVGGGRFESSQRRVVEPRSRQEVGGLGEMVKGVV
jgi:hypothetical protein